MSIPKRTTLKQRLEFYKFALKEISDPRNFKYICFAMATYYKLDLHEIKLSHLKKLYPEVYNLRDYPDDNSGVSSLWETLQDRQKALKKAIQITKKKIACTQKKKD